VSSGVHRYPEDPFLELTRDNVRALQIEARATAERLGDARLANSVMLGAAASSLPFAEGVLRDEVLRRFARGALATQNAAAFDAGRALIA
jgi:indolepyruvate ferredoxin oxidoreductase beta subunit